MNNDLLIFEDDWQHLKQFTPARIALGRSGMSLPTKVCLDFSLAHAMARDAVTAAINFEPIAQSLESINTKTVVLHSQAENQHTYLKRPDLGRLLNDQAYSALKANPTSTVDIVIVIADGLSSSAIEHHAVPFLELLIPRLREKDYAMPPICLVKHGRVAIGDSIAQYYSARLCVVLIGERPGLSSPSSMGIYFTYQAKKGSTDAERNCISNIHHEGLSYSEALIKLLYLINESEKLQFSGVNLKDESTNNPLTYGF